MQQAIGILTLSFLLACGGAQTQKEEAASTPQPVAKGQSEEATALSDMHGHFEDVNAIKLAIISGNLLAARSLATKVRLGFAGTAPDGWQPYIQRSVASAEMLEVTDDLGMAAMLASTMAGTCGDCHRAQGQTVIAHGAIAPPPEEDALSNFMTQHHWAADRMWEGIIGPSEQAWQAGAVALQDTKIRAEDFGERLTVTPELETLLAQLALDAAAAKATPSGEERQKLFGRFLSGCAGCHLEMKNQRD